RYIPTNYILWIYRGVCEGIGQPSTQLARREDSEMSRKAVVSVSLVALLGVGGTLAYFFGPWSKPANELRLYGTVEVQDVRLGPRVSGRVAEVFVRESQVVEPGQEILRLEARDLQAQLKQARRKEDAADARLLKADNGPRKLEIYAAEAARKAAEWKLA